MNKRRRDLCAVENRSVLTEPDLRSRPSQNIWRSCDCQILVGPGREQQCTYSYIPFGTWKCLDLCASTGKRAPSVDPTRMMKIEATLRPNKEGSPPPDPQLMARVS